MCRRWKWALAASRTTWVDFLVSGALIQVKNALSFGTILSGVAISWKYSRWIGMSLR